ncbi:MAG: hypothetical protein Q9200_002045 [Gallowayella weberi]
MATAALGTALTGAAIQMIGPISETLTQVVQFSIMDFLTGGSGDSDGSSHQDTLVRVRAGADDGGVQNNLGGNTPRIVGYDSNLRKVGTSSASSSVSISDGQFANLKISGGRQTPTLDFTAGGTDGICISDVYMKWADNQGFAFDGSWFKWCNMWWYHSSITLKTSSGGSFQPPCGWLDSDASKGHRLAGFRVDMLELQNVPNINSWGKNDVQGYCQGAFKWSGTADGHYQAGNLATTGDEATKGEKRSLGNGTNPANTTVAIIDETGRRSKLVISHFEGQSAQELCESKKSRGPDFVSMAEMKYCDMSEKKIYRLCSPQTRRECFSLDHEKKRLKRRGGPNRLNDAVQREYGKIIRWGPG